MARPYSRWQGDDANAAVQTRRCKRVRGPARDQPCEFCAVDGIEKPALDWAHVHGRSGLDVWADFVSLCRKCHMAYDGHATSPERRARQSEILKQTKGQPGFREAFVASQRSEGISAKRSAIAYGRNRDGKGRFA